MQKSFEDIQVRILDVNGFHAECVTEYVIQVFHANKKWVVYHSMKKFEVFRRQLLKLLKKLNMHQVEFYSAFAEVRHLAFPSKSLFAWTSSKVSYIERRRIILDWFIQRVVAILHQLMTALPSSISNQDCSYLKQIVDHTAAFLLLDSFHELATDSSRLSANKDIRNMHNIAIDLKDAKAQVRLHSPKILTRSNQNDSMLYLDISDCPIDRRSSTELGSDIALEMELIGLNPRIVSLLLEVVHRTVSKAQVVAPGAYYIDKNGMFQLEDAGVFAELLRLDPGSRSLLNEYFMDTTGLYWKLPQVIKSLSIKYWYEKCQDRNNCGKLIWC